MVDCGNLVTEDSIQSESSDALVNPLTPLPLQSENLEFKNSGVEWNWHTREDVELEASLVISKGDTSVALLEDNIGDKLLSKSFSQPSILKDLNSLRMKSNRGRPRKIALNKENKHFKISKSKEKRWK